MAGHIVNDDNSVERALSLAVQRGDVRKFRELIEQGADVNAPLSNGDTLLHVACDREDESMVEALLAAGASVDPRAADGTTPFARAARQRNKPICRQLLAAGADIHVWWGSGETPLRQAVRQYSFDFIDFLISNGASSSFVPENRESNYLTPFQWAIYHGFGDIVAMLASRCNEDLSQRTVRGRSLLQITGSNMVKDLLRSLRMTSSIGAIIVTEMPSERNAAMSQTSARNTPQHSEAL